MTIESLDFFLLRTPRLPYKTIDKLNAQRSPGDLAEYLYNLFQAQDLQDAVYLASTPLYHELMKCLALGPASFTPKLVLTLYKYVVRMAARTTPFGLFAGVSLGQIIPYSSNFTRSGQMKPVYRMDMGLAAHMIRWSFGHTDIRKHIEYRINGSVISFDDHYRYLGYRIEQHKRHYTWMRLTRNPLVDRLVSYIRQTQHYEGVISFLQQNGLDESQSDRYLNLLAKNQFLVSNVEPVVTGGKAVYFPPSLNSAREEIAKIPIQVRDDFEGSAIQADLSVGMTHNRLSVKTAQLLMREINELLPLARRRTPAELVDFCRQFSLRYETQEIRLLEALDPDRGIGYGDTSAGYRTDNGLVQGLHLNERQNADTSRTESLHQLIRRHGGINLAKTKVIDLSTEDIQALAFRTETPDDIATTGYVMGQLIATGPEALDHGDFFLHLQAADASSALPIMARFCHLDSELELKLRQCALLEDKASPDVRFAEIVFLPDDRVGNIMLRPSLREYELALVGHTATSEQKRISISDLWISVVNGRVMLRSAQLNMIILPRLSCAHNYRRGTSLYRFLCDLQHQSHSLSIGWEWGEYGAKEFLPRITYKHLILSRAKWLITAPDDKDFFQCEPLAAITTLRKRHRLPRKVILAEGDNELALDLAHFVGAEILFKYLKRSSVTLYENLMTKGHSPVRARDGSSYHNEIILPFKTRGSVSVVHRPQFQHASIRRSFPPGSEWAYLKLYMGLGESERVLSTQVERFIGQLKAQGLLKRWFFVRYADPGHHLRVRVQLRDRNGQLPFQEFNSYVNAYFEPAMSQGIIHRIQYDTYVRELERYGGADAIIPCEMIFQLDSETTLKLIPHFRLGDGERYRWLWAMIAVDDLLEGFGLTVQTKLQWVTEWHANFFNEFGAHKSLQLKLDQKFRENRAFVEQGFDATRRHIGNAGPLRLRFEAISGMDCQAWLTPHIAASLSHMFINRHFHTDQREMELIIYHFLTKTYRITLSRNVCAAHP